MGPSRSWRSLRVRFASRVPGSFASSRFDPLLRVDRGRALAHLRLIRDRIRAEVDRLICVRRVPDVDGGRRALYGALWLVAMIHFMGAPASAGSLMTNEPDLMIRSPLPGRLLVGRVGSRWPRRRALGGAALADLPAELHLSPPMQRCVGVMDLGGTGHDGPTLRPRGWAVGPFDLSSRRWGLGTHLGDQLPVPSSSGQQVLRRSAGCPVVTSVSGLISAPASTPVSKVSRQRGPSVARSRIVDPGSAQVPVSTVARRSSRGARRRRRPGHRGGGRPP